MKRVIKVLSAGIGLISVGAVAGAFIGRIEGVKKFLDGIHTDITAKLSPKVG